MYVSRITDAVEKSSRAGKHVEGVRVVKNRNPDRLRWKSAVGRLMGSAGRMSGTSRMRIEEPVREVVIDLEDSLLRREVVIDARRANVDIDRGEVLPFHSMGDLRRYAHLVGADMTQIERYVHLPTDFMAPIDTAACVLVGRAMANFHRRRAQKIWLEFPNELDPTRVTKVTPWNSESTADKTIVSKPHPGYFESQYHKQLHQQAEADAELARRWQILADRLLKKG